MMLDVELWNSEQNSKLQVAWPLSCLEDRDGEPERQIWSMVGEEAGRLAQGEASAPEGAGASQQEPQKAEDAQKIWAAIDAEAARLAGESGAQKQDAESKKADE
jgi:hypothetical protein